MEYTLHYLLMADHVMLQKQFFSRIADLGLSPGQPKVLDFLKDNDGAMQKEIARGCHIEPASLSAILTGMEKAEVIRRVADSKNRRKVNVYITEKGKAVCKRICKEFSAIEQELLRDFSEAEAQKLNEYLTKIFEKLER